MKGLGSLPAAVVVQYPEVDLLPPIMQLGLSRVRSDVSRQQLWKTNGSWPLIAWFGQSFAEASSSLRR